MLCLILKVPAKCENLAYKYSLIRPSEFTLIGVCTGLGGILSDHLRPSS